MATDYDKEIDSILSDLDTLHDTKVDAVNGKQLSTNDFTNEHLRKVNRIETKEYQQEIVAGVAKDIQQANDNHVRLADEFHRHLYGQDGVDAKFRKEIQDNLNYMSGLVKSANDRMNEIWQNWDEIVKEDQNHELRLQQVEGKTLTHDALIDSNTSEILNIQGEQVIQNNQIKEMQDKNVELETRVVDVEVSDADQNHRLDIAENRIGTFTDRMTALEDGYAQRDARMDGLDAQVSRYTERMLAIELNEKAQDERIKAEVEKNKRQDIDIACLYAEAKDRTINVDTEGTAIELQNSREGFVTINSIEGNTMVNCNKDVDKEVTLLTSTVDVTAENNVTLTEGVVDGGKVDVYLEGNTLVNVSKTKEATPITHKSEDTTGNHIALADEGSIRPVLNGNTLVNVCDQKDPIAITKSYTVETGNHVALQGEYDGKCRPVVTGNTLVNLWNGKESYSDSCSTYCKTNTTYTFILDSIGTVTNGQINIGYENGGDDMIIVPNGATSGRYIKTITTNDSASYLKVYRTLGDSGFSFKVIILEGDYTNKPIPEYFEGLQSSFEDKVVTQEMVDAGEEVAENLGKYKVEYKVTGKNKCPTTFYSGWINDNNYTLEEVGSKDNILSDIIKVKPYTDYTVNSASYQYKFLLDENKNFIEMVVGGATFNTKNANYVVLGYSVSYNDITPDKYTNIQIEEGSEATSYEPYKEYKKIFYLNSPLLEGDTIEQQGDNVVHVHRYGSYIFDTETDRSDGTDLGNTIRLGVNITNSVNCSANNSTSISTVPFLYSYNTDTEHQYISNNWIQVFVNKNKLSNNKLINPITVAYQLATPQYEIISQSDTILCDSYTNGHLDVDSVVPIKKVVFTYTGLKCKYLYPLSNYVVQFESDNIGIIDGLSLGGAEQFNIPINKGINKINAISGDNTSNPYLDLKGIGFNASNIVVTPAIEQDFDYFSGMQSCFEDSLVTEGENEGKYKIDYKVSDSDGVEQYTKTLYLNSPLLEGDTIEEKDGNIYHVHRYDKVVLDGSEDESWNINSTSLNNTVFAQCSMPGLKSVKFTDILPVQHVWDKDIEGIHYNYQYNTVHLRLNKSRLSTFDTDGIKQWIQSNPVTVVYELATPQYELIQQGTIAMPTYANGHLDVTTAVPVDKVNFLHFEEELTYLYPATSYTVQFMSDKAITVDITLGGKKLMAQSIATGLNKITITTPETLTDNKLIIDGVNANIKEVVVTNSDREFGYFEGMKSVGECEDLEVVSCNKNLFNYTKFCEFVDKRHLNPKGYSYHSFKINLKPNTSYSFTREDDSGYGLNNYIVLNDIENSYMSYNDDAVWIAHSDVEGLNQFTARFNTKQRNYMYITFAVEKTTPEETIAKLKAIMSTFQLEEGDTSTDYIPHAHNTQTLTHEPLRAVGDIKDKYVLIDGKWYIERNCGEYIITDVSGDEWGILEYSTGSFLNGNPRNYPHKPNSECICDKLKSLPISTNNIPDLNAVSSTLSGNEQWRMKIINCETKEDYIEWVSKNPLKVIVELLSPTYEPIDYNPFEVYNEVTHISTNSTIPCNVTVKNHGYNCILKPSTTYTVVSNQGVQNMTTPATLGDSLRFSGNGVLKDVMILEGTLSDNQIPGNFAGMESCYEQKKITDEHDEHFGYYEVTAKVVGKNLFNKDTAIQGYVDTDGSIHQSRNSMSSDYIQVKSNTTYTHNTGYENWALYDSNKNFIKQGYVKPLTTTSNTSYIRVTIKPIDYINEFQLEQGDTATEYEPYKESVIKFYIKDPLRGIGDLKDKVFVEDGKVKILRNCGQREYVEGDFETYVTDKVNTVYPLAEPFIEEVDYNGIRLSQNIWEKSTLFFDTNIPSTANISYSISTPVLDQVAEVSSITDDQDALIIDMATQLAVLTLTM